MSFWFKKRKKASAAAPMPKHPGEYAQDCNQSLLKDGRYDPTRVSSHENDVVKEVILASRKKYSRPYQGIGLAVETYPLSISQDTSCTNLLSRNTVTQVVFLMFSQPP